MKKEGDPGCSWMEVEIAQMSEQQLLRENWVQKAATFRLGAQLEDFAKKITEEEDICVLAKSQFLPLQEIL